jgi:hypothetical protein
MRDLACGHYAFSDLAMMDAREYGCEEGNRDGMNSSPDSVLIGSAAKYAAYSLILRFILLTPWAS